jgi:hypothetical protein
MKKGGEHEFAAARFPFAGTLAVATVTPASAHTVVKQGNSSIPDLSGVWTHSIPGFEPLASGPTALVNRSRRPNGTGNILQLVGDYTNPRTMPIVRTIRAPGEFC